MEACVVRPGSVDVDALALDRLKSLIGTVARREDSWALRTETTRSEMPRKRALWVWSRSGALGKGFSQGSAACVDSLASATGMDGC